MAEYTGPCGGTNRGERNLSNSDNYWTRYRGHRVSRRGFVAGAGTFAAGSAALLAGCGDDDDSASPTAAATTAAPGSTAAAATTTAANAPVKGGTLQISKSEKDDGLDPAGRVVNQDWVQAQCYSWTSGKRASTNSIAPAPIPG